MAIFYRGAGVGTWWHANEHDPRISGFSSQCRGVSSSVDQVMKHITQGTTTTPYISLTRSWGVALGYAKFGRVPPTAATPAQIWEIEINNPAPDNLRLIDPVRFVAESLPSPLERLSYQHDGSPKALVGLIDLAQEHLVREPVPTPPNSNPPNKALTVTTELQALMFALRDAELLAIGTIPSSCVRGPYNIY